MDHDFDVASVTADTTAKSKGGFLWSSLFAIVVKICIFVWMLGVLFMYMVMFMPPELKLFLQRLGGEDMINKVTTLQAWVNQFFSPK